ncbi:MAG TPA: response regulator transcription factor [Thermodesulfobacteriota bacterium]|nr:response regulator transcription factor [Thermodesulfobacteriota bacterium]
MVVLVVEDNAIFRKLVRESLEGEFPFLEVCEASGGEEAIHQCGTCMPDLIFMDIDLGDESGFSVIREIRARYPDVPIAILTSFELPEYKDLARSYNIDHFVVKGAAAAEDIFAVVEEVLNDSGAGPERRPV